MHPITTTSNGPALKGGQNSQHAPSGWPPVGWVTGEQAARMLGVAVATLTCNAWRWRLRCGKCVRRPDGGRGNIYPVAEIERVRQARAEAAGPTIPPGFVDRDGACRVLGVSRSVWKRWIRQGNVRFGRIISTPIGGKQKLYAVADLERLRQDLSGDDKLFKAPDGHYHVPAGLVRREEAWAQFGVSKGVWERWEREGQITCGIRVPGGPKLYKVEDLKRMLEDYGKLSPPYADPQRPGSYRVPLSGREIRRREAIIDTDALSLIEGGSCTWSPNPDGTGCVVLSRGGDVHSVPLRRIVLGITDKRLQLGHANGDPLDCLRDNLVVRTVQQRTRRARKMVRNHLGQPCSSRFKGVHWNQVMKRWYAAIRFEGKKRSLGHFRDEIAAALAYDEAARLWFGESARLNFPAGVDAFLEVEAAKGDDPQARAAA